MILKSMEGYEFELTIVDYQFPDITDDKYDSNWLQIRVRVKTSTDEWSVTDPCLNTGETEQLAKWLNKYSEFQGVDPDIDDRIDFTEPNLSFRIAEQSNEIIKIRIYFDQECRPPWKPCKRAGLEDCWIDLDISTADLRNAADSLIQELTQFPRRGLKLKYGN